MLMSTIGLGLDCIAMPIPVYFPYDVFSEASNPTHAKECSCNVSEGLS